MNPTNAVLAAVRGHFIDDLAQAWKKFSVIVLAAIVALPELYQAAGAAGLLTIETVPPKFQWAVRVAGIFGLYVRLVKQTRAAAEAAVNATADK